jgi:antibiotic biosynthesis monooxygenase (ABM) superfamily enzyme
LSSPPEGSNGPVTTTVTRRVKPGHEPVYERFLEGIIAAASGFRGTSASRCSGPWARRVNEYQVVDRFDTAVHLRSWLDSDERVPSV